MTTFVSPLPCSALVLDCDICLVFSEPVSSWHLNSFVLKCVVLFFLNPNCIWLLAGQQFIPSVFCETFFPPPLLTLFSDVIHCPAEEHWRTRDCCVRKTTFTCASCAYERLWTIRWTPHTEECAYNMLTKALCSLVYALTGHFSIFQFWCLIQFQASSCAH